MSPETNQHQLPDAPPINDATLISRSPTVLTADTEGEVLMMCVESGSYFSLNEVGSEIWRLLDPPCSFAELIDRLAADYDATRATIEEDVRTLLARLVAQDIVRLA